MLTRTLLAPLITLAACGGSSSNAPDAAPGDAAGQTVMAVTCPATVPLTVDAPDSDNKFVFTPANMPISVGSIVKFTMHSDHTVVPNPLEMTDAGLKVNRNETKCLMFTRAGTFGFQCGMHHFVGTVTVQ